VATYLAWRLLGLIAFPICAPLWAIALARPILDLMGESHRVVKTLAFADVQGQHYVHRGNVLDIAEDERHQRWVSVRDVRKVLPDFPRDALLKQQYAPDCRDDGGRAGLRLRAEALLRYLEKSGEPAALKFRVWLEREVVRPAMKRRERLGIRDEVASAGDGGGDPRDASADGAPGPATTSARPPPRTLP
jgi:hypothetical protein